MKFIHFPLHYSFLNLSYFPLYYQSQLMLLTQLLEISQARSCSQSGNASWRWPVAQIRTPTWPHSQQCLFSEEQVKSITGFKPRFRIKNSLYKFVRSQGSFYNIFIHIDISQYQSHNSMLCLMSIFQHNTPFPLPHAFEPLASRPPLVRRLQQIAPSLTTYKIGEAAHLGVNGGGCVSLRVKGFTRSLSSGRQGGKLWGKPCLITESAKCRWRLNKMRVQQYIVVRMAQKVANYQYRQAALIYTKMSSLNIFTYANYLSYAIKIQIPRNQLSPFLLLKEAHLSAAKNEEQLRPIASFEVREGKQKAAALDHPSSPRQACLKQMRVGAGAPVLCEMG